MPTQAMDIMERAEMLPIDLKLELVDRLLESISPSQKDIDELWKIEVERRIDEVESGEVKTIPGDEVFAKIRGRQKRRITLSIWLPRLNLRRQSSFMTTAMMDLAISLNKRSSPRSLASSNIPSLTFLFPSSTCTRAFRA